MRRPRPWLWLLAWGFLVLLSRAIAMDKPVPHLREPGSLFDWSNGTYHCSHNRSNKAVQPAQLRIFPRQ